MLEKKLSKSEVMIGAILRVLIATVCTVAAMIAVANLVEMLSINKSLIIPSTIITGICGFIYSIYWTMTYFVKSGYAQKK